MSRNFRVNFLIFTALLLGCVGGLAYVLLEGEADLTVSDSWVLDTHESIIEAERLNTLIARLVSSQRGFLISESPRLLDEYRNRRSGITVHLNRMAQLTRDNHSQQDRVEKLRQLIADLDAQLQTRITEAAGPGSLRALEDIDTVKALKSRIFALSEDYLDEEYSLLNLRITAVEQKKNQYFRTLLIGGTLAVVLMMVLNAYLLRAQTRRSAAEIALDEREAVFRLAMEGTQDGVFDWDIKSGDTFFSDRIPQMLGYEPEEFTATFASVMDLAHPDDREEAREYLELYLDDQLSEYDHTFRVRHRSGHWIWIQTRGKVIRDAQGRPSRMVGAYSDVSAHKEYELKLQEAKNSAEEANRAKSDFLAHMSHEIRTPLTTISGVAEIMAGHKADFSEQQQTFIDVLKSSSMMLKDLVSEILDFSKIESGELELEDTEFALQEPFEQVISMASVRASDKGLGFHFDYGDLGALQVVGDPARLRQILMNLVTNAIKFTDGGSVSVHAHRETRNDTDVLQVDIRDTGIGISEEEIDSIFGDFKQADSSISRKYGGTGLGLPISRHLAELMGGDIHVSSTPGQGSEFSLVIPLRTHAPETGSDAGDDVHRSKEIDRLKSTIAEKSKVLLVEDYEGNIAVLSYRLKALDCEFDVARTGLEAVKLWKENHYDLILMDIQMPEMDGLAATRAIRTLERETAVDSTPIIGMTAHALVGDKDKCIEAGMDAYLAKPVDNQKLNQVMQRYLSG